MFKIIFTRNFPRALRTLRFASDLAPRSTREISEREREEEESGVDRIVKKVKGTLLGHLLRRVRAWYRRSHPQVVLITRTVLDGELQKLTRR